MHSEAVASRNFKSSGSGVLGGEYLNKPPWVFNSIAGDVPYRLINHCGSPTVDYKLATVFVDL